LLILFYIVHIQNLGGDYKKMGSLRLKDLEETRSFYKKELKDEELTGGERDSFLRALKLIEGFIERENLRELGTRVIKNKYLKPDGGFDLIEKFPVYESKRKQKIKR